MSLELTKFIESWARRWANERGGSGQVDLDRTHPTFAEYYQNYGIDIGWSMGAYTIGQKVVDESSVYSAEYGPFTHEKTIDFAHSLTATDTFEWSLTESISVGASASVSVGVPSIFSAEAGAFADLSISSTQGQVKEISNVWDTNVQFTLQPEQRASLEMIRLQLVADATAQLVGTVTGAVAIGFDNQWNNHYFWFPSIAELAAYNERSDIERQGDEVVIRIPVQFKGTAVTETYVREKRTKANGETYQLTHSRITRPSQRGVFK